MSFTHKDNTKEAANKQTQSRKNIPVIPYAGVSGTLGLLLGLLSGPLFFHGLGRLLLGLLLLVRAFAHRFRSL